MNRRMIGTALALLLLGVPAAAVRASDPPGAAPPPAAGAPQPGNPAPLPAPMITSDQAEAALRQFFPLPARAANMDWQWNLSRRGNKPTWDLQVTIREGNSAMGFALASVDAVTGRILHYGGYGMLPEPIRVGPLSPVHTEEEARARAWSLVQKLVPERAAGLQEAPRGMPALPQPPAGLGYPAGNLADAYRFTWIEYHDGVPVPASSVSVAVHKQTLDYVLVDVNLLDPVPFQAGPARVTPDQALSLWQQARPSLVYQPVPSTFPLARQKPSAFQLIYTFPDLGRAVDAMTGTWVTDSGPLPPAGGDAQSAAPEPVPAGSTPPVVPQQLPLTAASARQLALSVLELPPDADLSADTNLFFGGEMLLQFSSFGPTGSGTVMFEPTTGLIRQAYRSQPMGQPPGPGQQPVTPEQEAQAKQAAIAVVQSYYSQIRDQLRLLPAPPYWGPPDDRVRRFMFVRYVNDIPVSTDSVQVTINLSTMKWEELDANWTTGVTFPSPAAAITPEQARATLMANRQPMLVYLPSYPAMGPGQVSGGAPQPTAAKLVYLLTPGTGFQVDALTGQVLGNDDIEAAAQKVTGHWAEGALQFMLFRGMIRPEELNPDAALTRGQAVALLLSRSPRIGWPQPPAVDLPYTDLADTDPAYGAVQLAWSEGWLRPLGDETTFRSGAAITRAEFVVWAARALGLGELARSGLTAEDQFRDLAGLTPEQRNAANFLRALGLLSPADTFRGGDPLTQAEGAALTVRIYNYLLSR